MRHSDATLSDDDRLSEVARVRPAGNGPGTGLRDGLLAVVAAAALSLGLAAAAPGGHRSGAAVALLAVLAGTGLVAVAGWSVARRPQRWCGPADRVTLARAALVGGVAALAVRILAGELPPRPWWLLALVAPALVLDAVDGAVARRTGTSSAAGARLDMETDAALLLVLSLVATGSLGWWVLGIGTMRYGFVLLLALRPRLRRPLAFSQFRRVVAAVQGVVLVATLTPAVPLTAARWAVAGALLLLTVSFGRDLVGLERAARRGPAVGIPAQR